MNFMSSKWLHHREVNLPYLFVQLPSLSSHILYTFHFCSQSFDYCLGFITMGFINLENFFILIFYLIDHLSIIWSFCLLLLYWLCMTDQLVLTTLTWVPGLLLGVSLLLIVSSPATLGTISILSPLLLTVIIIVPINNYQY